MTLNFYTLGVLYLVYSFLGWVGETVVATFRGKRFANRGMAAGPFCFVYGTTAILMAVGFADMRTKPVALFVACMLTATVVEWLTAKLLERLHNRKWWDYSDKKFNLNGYVCLQYSLLWGALGTASVLWGNDVLLRLCAQIEADAARVQSRVQTVQLMQKEERYHESRQRSRRTDDARGYPDLRGCGEAGSAGSEKSGGAVSGAGEREPEAAGQDPHERPASQRERAAGV